MSSRDERLKTGRTTLGDCWDAIQRVDYLFAQAKKLGLDAPSDTMIEDAIRDAEFNALWNPLEIAEQHDQYLPELQKVWQGICGHKSSAPTEGEPK